MPELLEQLRSILAEHYAIERQIGAGGMAAVYLARDLKHERKVALKVLNPDLGVVLGAERFLSEIRVTANLQHPNLLPLFDSGAADGLLYYVMPYVAGENLRATLAREKQLPVEDALHIALAVASALDYAHRHGVIHRDLKPENILLHEGQPLVADFGIALAVSNAGGNRITQTGLSLGTPQYMSPEQATGDRVIDGRSDVYSLGAVLYEMLTGEPPHTGNTSQAVIARVLTEKPRSIRATRASVSEHIELAVGKALEKLPADRFTTAGEFAAALRGEAIGPAHARTAAGAAAGEATVIRIPALLKQRVRRALPWATAIVGLALAGATALGGRPRTEPEGWPTLFSVTFSDSVEALSPGGSNIAISRDGSQIAFDGRKGKLEGIFVRRLDALDAHLVSGTEGGARPLFSPDGTWLLFEARDGKLKKVPVGGGAPIAMYESEPWHRSWGDRDVILVVDEGRLVRVSANGRSSTPLATPDSTRQHAFYWWPSLLPGSDAALITIQKIGGATVDDDELGLVSLSDGKVTELGVRGLRPIYASSGHVIFGRSDGAIFAAPFSLRRLRLTGPEVPILQGVYVNQSGGVVEIALSDNGTLLYKTGLSEARSLVRVDRNGRQRAIGVDSLYLANPRVSGDGRRIAVTVTDHIPNIWTKDLVNGTFTRVTTDSGARPEWMPDGRRLTYWSVDGAKQLIKTKPWDGSGQSEVFTRSEDHATTISLGPRGSFIAVRTGDIARGDIFIAPADSPLALRPFVATPAAEGMPRISPDGKVLAYISDETGRREVYVRPLPGPGGRVQVSTSGGDEPMWAPAGSVLYYRSPTRFMSAVIRDRPELDVARRDSLFVDEYVRNPGHANYDVFPGGSEFVFVKSATAEGPRLIGIVNWTTELRRRTQSTLRPN